MFELVNTSLPNGLLPGTHGFATVAMTHGLADNLRRRLEDLSAYVHKTSAHDATYDTLNPVAWSHLILPRGEHVLGRIAAAPFDYTGRTNRLARLVCLTAAEAKTFNAAETLLRENAYFSAPWEGEARWLEPDATLSARIASPSTRASRKSQTWIDAFGEANGSRYAAGFAAMLRDSIRQNGKPLTFVTSQQSDTDGRRALAFIADLIALLPEDLQVSATFSTYPCAIPIGVKCAIRVLRKDDNGYAQAIAGVPVADFASKTVQNANLLPHDAELEHLAATGNLPAPAAPVETAPQTEAAQQSATVKAATAETIDVSIDIPPTTESDKAIAVTGKDASHRKPKLKHRPGQSTNMPVQGRRFDPLFGQPSKRSNGPLIAAVAAGVVLILAIAAVLVHQSKMQGYKGSDDPTIQRVRKEQEQEEIIESEQKAAEAQREADAEKRRNKDMEAAKRVEAKEADKERLARENATSVAKPSVAANAKSGKAAPLCTNISVIVRCADDKEAKLKFGNPTKDSLSSGSIWYYDGAMIKSCSFTDKESGKDRSWFTIDSDNHKYELVDPKDLPNAKDIKYCRIWYFNKNPNTLYWVTNKVDRAEFELNPPHNNAPINLVKELFGPDLRVLAQWEAYFGNVNCRAWAADGTNRLDWQEVDAGAFVPSVFIAKCRELRIDVLTSAQKAMDVRYREATDPKNQTIKNLLTKEKRLKQACSAANSAWNIAKNKVIAAKVELEDAKKNIETVEQSLRTARDEVSRITGRIQAEKNRLGGLTKRSEQGRVKAEIARLNEELKNANDNVNTQTTLKEEAGKILSTKQRNLTDAQTDCNNKEGDKKRLDKDLKRVQDEIDQNSPEVLKAQLADIETAIKAFPSVEEARKQWTIHVKVELGGGK